MQKWAHTYVISFFCHRFPNQAITHGLHMHAPTHTHAHRYGLTIWYTQNKDYRPHIPHLTSKYCKSCAYLCEGNFEINEFCVNFIQIAFLRKEGLVSYARIRERVIKNRPPVSKPRRECKRETRLIKGNWGLGPRLHPPVQMALFPYQSPIVAWTKLKKTAWSPRHQEERQMPVRRGQF